MKIEYLSPMVSEKELFKCNESETEKGKYRVTFGSSMIETKITTNPDQSKDFELIKTDFKNYYEQKKLIGYIVFVLIAGVWDK